MQSFCLLCLAVICYTYCTHTQLHTLLMAIFAGHSELGSCAVDLDHTGQA